MNDAQLTEQLRALRQPPPASGFETGLQQALWREAQALRAERTPARPAAARRLLRWGGRMGVGVAVALGATAAAAAGGVWVFVAERAPGPAVLAVPASEDSAQVSQRGVRGSRRIAREPVLDVTATTPPEASAPAEPAPAAGSEPSGEQPPSERGRREQGALPAPSASSPARKAAIAGAEGRSTPRAAARATHSAPASGLALFDLPERRLPAPAPSERAASGRTDAPDRRVRPEGERAQPEVLARGEGARARPEGERRQPDVPARAEGPRARPERPSRAEGPRARPERPQRERGAGPPGREIARERSGRDNAERGLERARQARERNERKK